MAISTSTSVTEAVSAKLHSRVIEASLKENAILAASCHEANTEGQKGHKTGQYLYADGLSAAALGSEGAATTATEFTLTEATATASEYTVAVEIADLAEDSAVPSIADAAVNEIAIALLDKAESVIGALASGFTGASQNISDTGVEIDFDDMLLAKTNLRTNALGKARNAAYFLYDNSVLHLQKRGLSASNGLAPALSRERILGLYGDTMNSAVLGAQVGSFCEIPVFQTTHIPSANAGADSANMLIVVGQGGAIMINWKWRVKVKIAETTVNGKFGKFLLGGIAVGVVEARDSLGATMTFKRAA